MEVDRDLGAAERGGEDVGALFVVPGSVVASDGVVVGDGSAGRDDRVADRRLDLVPLGDLVAASARDDHRVLRRRPVRTHVREATRHATWLPQCLARGTDDALVEGREALPRDRRLAVLRAYKQHSRGPLKRSFSWER